MTLDRRSLLAAGAGLSALAATAASAGTRLDKTGIGQNLLPGDPAPKADASDRTAELQAMIDRAAKDGTAVLLPPGLFRVSAIELRDGTKLLGTAGLTTLEFTGGAKFLHATNAANIHIENLVLDGALIAPADGDDPALLSLDNCGAIHLSRLIVRQSLGHGIVVKGSSGRIADCTVHNALLTGIFSLDATGLEIVHNTVRDCGNNGIQVWRRAAGEDGTLIAANRIQRISSKGGGTGQNGNGINIYRAGSVRASDNRITDCTYSAIRANAASNVLMTGNSCERIGEVALYAEFGFEGALIANNLVDGAASGIAVTNFNEGGRLAVVQGNLIRNLKRREHEPVDKRGDGISVEADSLVSGNVIENAPTAGIMVGWGPYMRNCSVTQNLIRDAATGILISADDQAGACLIANNMISGTKTGAIRAMRDGAPIGPDLAIEKGGNARVAVTGNVVA